jgi:Flp pilus assembly pilin Flp
MRHLLRSLWANDNGQSLVEYALIVVLVAVVLVFALVALRDTISAAINDSGGRL